MVENIWDRGRWANVDSVTFDFMTHYIMERLSSRVSFKNKTVLELGAGTGRLSYLALKAGARHVTLVDSSQKAVALAASLFVHEKPNEYSIVKGGIFEFPETPRYDIVLSSGVVEHFREGDRARVIRKHVECSQEDCLIIHPTRTLYSFLFNNFPLSIRLYGYQESFSDKEMNICIESLNCTSTVSHERFHTFYTVPLLHNWERLNRALDQSFFGRRYGGLTLTHISLNQGN